MSDELWEEMLSERNKQLLKLTNKYAARMRRQQVNTYLTRIPSSRMRAARFSCGLGVSAQGRICPEGRGVCPEVCVCLGMSA